MNNQPERYLGYEDGCWVYRSDVFTAYVSERSLEEDWRFVFLPEATNTQILQEFGRFLKAMRLSPVRKKPIK